MRIIQFKQDGRTCVGRVIDHDQVELVAADDGVYGLALQAIAENAALPALIERRATGTRVDYQALVDERRLLPPLTHPDPAHLLVSGTGLTHLGSAASRNAMHAKIAQDPAPSDSMKMFKLGVEGGKPAAGAAGVQPEWFYKGDGGIVVAPEADFPVPGFAQDAGEEPELAGVYVIDPQGRPRRIGFAIGNEFSDHVTERFNYLWLAHSKLRPCAFGPELLLGEAPADLQGTSRIVRAEDTLWEQPFATGEANMSHTLANLEHHHFKYAQFRRPGDAHVHFFGTATLSFADQVQTRDGDRFEISLQGFGRPLRNTVRYQPDAGLAQAEGL
ncbi:Fumarylacetoacetate (FAA) hydrolase family protein [Pigmentiphaga humi]|uniref:Fumarylacetoacetate (FAA) hydrolase family protein n=1 Tax=Pigmentiphaga humi TaxID=2478468 RepID=A0A3P4AXV9_9BURK|nr:AraD1 family protein [Pigmentiphaga humi]VCU68240.1 Fumarylacetoacetate (FAA) hydrolase family protein [Pigmentiphaga humi]